ncbi:MAG: tetratricopeptide repeat protein [Lachnospiraceae bacterium]|nr:tetratricopeptide repeat protein [Lachnospiraceae bacterium]MCM1239591.1 tetratricopeptide repeat protein [Lachnospiraceae bacterium]
MFCGKCGAEIENGGRFCPQCGTVVGEKQERAAAPVPAQKGTPAKKKLLAAVAACAVLAVAGVIALVVHITSPEYRSGKCVRQAEKYMQEESFQEAIEAYEEALDYLPENRDAETGLEDAYLGQAEKYMQESSFQEAIEAYREALDNFPENRDAETGLEDAYLGGADALYRDEDYEEAMEYYETVRELNPKRSEIYLGEADIYLKSEDVMAALTVLEEGEEFVSEDARTAREEYIMEHTTAYYEKAAQLTVKIPTNKKDLKAWRESLEACYPPEADEVLDELLDEFYDSAEIIVSYLDEETAILLEQVVGSMKVSDTRMLNREECEECEELIEWYYDISLKIDGGCLVGMEVVPDSELEKMLDELGDLDSTLLILRSGKYIGCWAFSDLGLDEITDLGRDLEW